MIWLIKKKKEYAIKSLSAIETRKRDVSSSVWSGMFPSLCIREKSVYCHRSQAASRNLQARIFAMRHQELQKIRSKCPTPIADFWNYEDELCRKMKLFKKAPIG